MRMLKMLAVGLAFATLVVGASARALEAGEVLVSYGDEIWRVDAESGDRSRFSPRAFALVNRIGPEGSAQIAIDPDGAIFLVSDGNVVEIDPATGVQSILQRREYVCVDVFCGFLANPLELGEGPRGIAVLDDPDWDSGAPRDLFVGCTDAIWAIRRDGGEVSSSAFVPDVSNYFQLTGPLVVALGGFYFTAKGDLHGSFSPPALSIAPGLGAPGNVTGLDHEGGVTVIAAQPGDGAPVAGVWYASTGGFVPITQGGFLRRPAGVAIDPLRMDRIFVTDVGPFEAPANRVIRLDYDGVDWRQTMLAEFPDGAELHGVAVMPVTAAPEPGAFALGALALLALGGLRRR